MSDDSKAALLSALLPSTPYLLAYALPLFVVSIVLTFAGSFLTLDRTRSFPPAYDAIPGGYDQRRRKRRLNFLLEGGVGGLAAGYVFGVHLSTFLVLLIPSLTSSATLTSKSFLPVWILSAIVTTFLAGRWGLIALGMSGITGGASLALSFAVIIHPPRLARVIVTAILVPAMFSLCVLPLERTRRASLRLALSSTGAFGLVLSIAVFSHISAWADVWDRLWVSDGEEWGTGKEKALSAAWSLLLACGMGSDWLLKRQFGSNPDQKWDHYLASYATNLPDRAGDFRPLKSWWNRIFSKSTPSDPIVFPTDDDMKLPMSPPMYDRPVKLQKTKSMSGSGVPGAYEARPGFLRKPTRTRSEARFARRTREAVKFQPKDGVFVDSSDEDDELDEIKTPPLATSNPQRPWLKSHPSTTSTTTLRGSGEGSFEKEKPTPGFEEDDVPEYSDYDEDAAAKVQVQRRNSRNEPGWTPDFIKRHVSSTTSQRTAVAHDPPPLGAVPATPSLIQALDRIAVAQKTAFNIQDAPQLDARPGLPASKSSDAGLNEGLPKQPRVNLGEGTPSEGRRGQRWEEFWRDVGAKAGV